MPWINASDLREPLHYCTSAYLGEGSIIEPGNWFRVLDKTKDNNADQNFKWLYEQLFESERRRIIPSAPSRINSSFVCRNKYDIDEFLRRTGRNVDIIYTVEPVIKQDKYFAADWALYNWQHGTPWGGFKILQAQQQAKQYWTSDSLENIEILIDAPLRVIGRYDV